MKPITQTHNKQQRRLVILLLFLFTGLAFRVQAQCHAGFTFYVDTMSSSGHVTFYNTSTGTTPGTAFAWWFGDGGTTVTYSVSDSVTYVYNATGTYYASLQVINDTTGCRDSIAYAISVVNAHPYCHAQFYHVDSAGYIYFADQSGGTGLTEILNFGDGDTAVFSGGAVHHYTTPGVYYACLSIHNTDFSCTDTYCDSVRVSSCSASFTSVPDAIGFGVTFMSTVGGSADLYAWNFGDGNTSTLANPHHVYASPGTYTVTLNVSSSVDPLCGAYATTNIYVSNFCDASFTMAQDSLDHYHYLIYANATSSSLNYFWDFGDGDTTHAQYPSHNYSGTGPYYICLTVTSADSSCNTTHCDSLYAGRSSENLSVTVVNHALTTGIRQQAAANTLLENYPNPFSGSTTIHYSIAANANVTLNVLDLLGNKIATLENGRRSAGSYSSEWNADGVAQGMYLLQLTVDTKVMTKKIIVNK